MKNAENREYYLGLDIGTDSVGYAVTDPQYSLLKFKGEPMWGLTTFEAAALAQDRRMHRTQRRRIDRRQQRVKLLEELFAPEIAKIDPRFFIRRHESALCRTDKEDSFALFSDDKYTDKEYSKEYPTIHHLICDLMQSNEPHDIRLVFHACAWLVAHRGHFLFDVSAENAASLSDFGMVYRDFTDYFTVELACALPWSAAVESDTVLENMKLHGGVGRKEAEFKDRVFNGVKPAKEPDEDFPFSRAAIMSLLCGRKVKMSDLYANEAYQEMESVSLDMDDEHFAAILAELGDDGELLRRLRAMSDCVMLITTSGGKMISEAKVDVYNQHAADLKWLKYFVRKYKKTAYNMIFRNAEKGNYTAYSGNVKSCKKAAEVKRASKTDFCDFLKKQLKDIDVEDCDREKYESMLTRLNDYTFLPKQRDTDNRVIPQQLYRLELDEILRHVASYLRFLNDADEDGLTVKEKILSIFDFKIPYYVGPLGKNGKFAWCKRKADGRIYPWNFEQKIDLDASEDQFIRCMTNTCTYLPGEDVLPTASLLYSRYTVLNEINNLKINGNSIPVEVKQLIYTELFEKHSRVSLGSIKELLRSRGLISKDDEISGVDIQIKSSLKSLHAFSAFLKDRKVTESEVESIIERAAYSEDKLRLRKWLAERYPQLTEDDRKYITRLNLKGFGRLSGKLLSGVYGTLKESGTGEALTIIEAMWQTNENLMQLLSDRYTYRESIEAFTREYYEANPQSLSDRLSEMYVSNAVKRPIIRTLDITKDIVKAMGCPPKKIFIEMARGGTADQKGKRTKTRKQQLLELYQRIKTDDVRRLSEQLDAMGDMADNRLQSDRLFLYYLQLGKCLYTGKAIDLAHMADGTYNIEHIYPQSHVKDDSILNNEILVFSEINGFKSDTYPVPAFIRHDMRSYWDYLKDNGLMTEEKHSRLIRSTEFTQEEQMNFINRQLVETRQSTKAVAEILGELYPKDRTEIVYVKAGLVSEFRQEFDMLKCRAVNDLHHAKDAYLNIVVGNVYHERFSKRWFSLDNHYNVQVKKIFGSPVNCGGNLIWNGGEDLARVRKTMRNNAVHITRYAFSRKGGYFDQNPVKAASGLVPLKKNLPTENYGGYTGTTVSFFILVGCKTGKTSKLYMLPVTLLNSDLILSSEQDASHYAKSEIEKIIHKPVDDVIVYRPVKVGAVFCVDGAVITIRRKHDSTRNGFAYQSPLLLSYDEESYIRKLSSFAEKRKNNSSIQLDEEYDKITSENNIALYNRLCGKLKAWPFNVIPSNKGDELSENESSFCKLPIQDQVDTLLGMLMKFSATGSEVDLTKIGIKMSRKTLHFCLSNWKNHDIRIIDQSASGLYESRSENLLNLL